VALIRAAFSILRTQRVTSDEERRVVFLIIATIPGAVAGLLVKDLAESTFRAPALTAVALIVMGTGLWAADRFARKDRVLRDLTWRDALLIGCAQVFALIPGVSRSGSTITAGRTLGLDRQSAAIFSFLMSMPITAAAALVKVPEALREGGLTPSLGAGILAAGISSWLAIAVLLRYVSSQSYAVFAVYRWVLGIVVLGLVVWRG
jgi:undecaprenyl-diphosphatase